MTIESRGKQHDEQLNYFLAGLFSNFWGEQHAPKKSDRDAGKKYGGSATAVQKSASLFFSDERR